MNKLDSLVNMGFKMTWKLICIGLFGYDDIPASLISREDIINYLDRQLTSVNEQTENMIALVCEKNDYEQFDKCLNQFARNEKSRVDIQKRKWRVYLLKQMLDGIDANADSFKGMLDLLEFWAIMEKPKDCPQSFPNSNDKSYLEEFFSQKSVQSSVKNNRIWLEKEISAINRIDN